MAYLECMICYHRMHGITEYELRKVCHECGGKSLDADRLEKVKDEALSRCKEYGEISRKYEFRKNGGSHI